MKHLLYVIFLIICAGCSEEQAPETLKPIQPPPPPRASKADYWLSHPTVVLLSGKYSIGADSIMSICNSFTSLYPNNGERNFTDRNDRAYDVMPYYTGLKDGGPTPTQSRAFFVSQSAKYGLAQKDIADIIKTVYSGSNSFTPRGDY